MKTKYSQEKIVNHIKSTGFVYQSSEIYDGLSNSWDYGPLGVLLKNNLKKLWWDFFVTKRPNMTGLDSSIILNSQVWSASGHLSNFSDPLIDCKECKSRFRADKLINEYDKNIKINEQTKYSELEKIINNNHIICPNCKKSNFTNIRKFNLLFKTYIGVIEDQKNTVYLRPETAQGIIINFKNIQRTTRLELPFGVAQIGKAFRNEITPSNFIFRTREFEQMEIEHFCKSDDEDKIFLEYENLIYEFLTKIIGLKKENLKKIDYPKNELSHYAKKTIDFFYNFPHGFCELWGLANRGTFDITCHENKSNKNLKYLSKDNELYVPSIIEPSVGVDRLLYAILVDSFNIENLDNNPENERVVLKLDCKLSPFFVCINPLSKKNYNDAYNYYCELKKKNISCSFEYTGSIGKRYRRQDAIGTYYSITFDDQFYVDSTLTIRYRDTMKQIRININECTKKLIEEYKLQD